MRGGVVRRLLWIGALGLAILILIALPDGIRTGRLMANLGKAAQHKGPSAPISEVDVAARVGNEIRTARRYQPDIAALRTAVIFIPGLTPKGIQNDRFVSVARALAGSGYLVLTPRLSGFDDFRLQEKAISEIGFWRQYLRNSRQFGVRKTGVIGVSVGGTLALLAAARLPECRDLDFVMSIGGYQDLEKCQTRWLSAAQGHDSHGRFPVQFYGRWILMLMALDEAPSSPDRDKLEQALTDLLAQATTSVSTSDLAPEAARWYAMAVGDRTDDPELASRIDAALRRRLQALSAGEELSAVHCPVFLIHGAYDELIPPEETLQLESLLRSADTTTLLTPVISHTHPLLDRMPLWSKAKALADGAIFLYRFVRVS